MISETDIKDYVIHEIASHANFSTVQMNEELRLKSHPLRFDNLGLLYLSKSLRGYVKRHTNGNETVKVKEIRSANLTVKQVVSLITKKIIK